MAIELRYQGRMYRRSKDYWVDSSNMQVPSGLQHDLDMEYAKTLDLSAMSVDELLRQGDEFKRSSSFYLASKCYEALLEKAEDDVCKQVFPRLTSCYRETGKARKVVELMTYIRTHYGMSAITPVLLTSVAGAYCDLKEYDNARKCAKRAYAMCGGKSSPELSLVFKRIDKEDPPRKSIAW